MYTLKAVEKIWKQNETQAKLFKLMFFNKGLGNCLVNVIS